MKYYIKDHLNETRIDFHPDGAPEGYVAIGIWPENDEDERGLVCVVPIESLLDAAEWCSGGKATAPVIVEAESINPAESDAKQQD